MADSSTILDIIGLENTVSSQFRHISFRMGLEIHNVDNQVGFLSFCTGKEKIEDKII